MLPETRYDSTPSKSKLERSLSMGKRYKYLRRILRYQHMDFEFALWQMIYLCINPKKVYRNFHYHKQTKNQWARDDPAFLVLLSFWLCVSSIGYAVALRLGFLGFVKFLFWVIFVDCIGVGLVIATILWFVSNKYLKIGSPHAVEQTVEWGYCFDVHLNAFFPLLIILHVVQLFCMPLVNGPWFLSHVIGNTLWLIAVVYYIYITFLGYSALPFLRGTIVILYPVVIVFIVYFISIGLQWNISQGIMDFYKYRVLLNPQQLPQM